MHTTTDKVLAIITSHNPDVHFVDRVAILALQVSKIVVVDNASKKNSRGVLRQLSKKIKNLELVLNTSNRGVGAALNQGIRIGIDEGYKWILTMDQDSCPASDMVSTLLAVSDDITDEEQIAIIAPIPKDPSFLHNYTFLRRRYGFLFERIPCSNHILEDVTIVINSGALHKVAVIKKMNGFREDFFIDYIDTEYCLRILEEGLKIIVSCDSSVEHRLGNQKSRRIGSVELFPTFHPPIRWYYISRNRIPMLLKYALRFPHWFSFEIISSIYLFIRMLLFEDRRSLKLQAFFFGTRDGLRGSMGEIPPELAKKLIEEH